MLGAVMAQISRCAAVSLCPTDEQIHVALRDDAVKDAATWSEAQRSENPKEFILTEVVAITRIANVHCGEPMPDEPTSVNCSFTFSQGGRVVFEVAKLAWNGRVWTISDSLAVSRHPK